MDKSRSLHRFAVLIAALVLGIFNCIYAGSTSQPGLVKSRGTLEKGGKVVAGAPIQNARVHVDSIIVATTDKHGRFSFKTNKPYYLITAASARGYNVIDQVDISYNRLLTVDPVVIVMANAEQYDADCSHAEYMLRRAFQRLRGDLEDRLDERLEAGRIDRKEYERSVKQLDELDAQNPEIIAYLAQNYASTDFDGFTQAQARAAYMILEGRLDDAAALVTSQGTLDTRAAALGDMPDPANLREVATDCLLMRDIALMRHNHDEAARCMEIYASLDPNNLTMQRQTVEYLNRYPVDSAPSTKYTERVAQIVLDRFGDEIIPETAVAANDLGLQKLHEGDTAEAVSLLDKAEKIFTKIYGPQSRQVATSHANLAIAHVNAKSYSDATIHLETAVRLWENIEDATPQQLYNAYNSIASVYEAMGHRQKSMAFYKRAIAIIDANSESIREIPGPNLAMALNNMGITCDNAGQSEEAMGYYERALKIWEHHYGSDHPQIARCCSNMAYALYHQDKWEDGLLWHERALDIQRRVSGADDPELASMLNNLGFVHYQLDNYQRAERLYREALRMWEKIEGPDAEQTARTRLNRGLNLIMMGEPLESLECVLEALASFEQLFGTDSPRIVDCLNKVSGIYDILGDKANADHYAARAAAIRK